MGFITFQGEATYRLNLHFDELQLVPAGPQEEGVSLPEARTVLRTIRLRNTLLAREMKRRYGNRCQVCRESVALTDRDYAEAHHLKPLGSPHFGPDSVANIIVVCPNHHIMFDRGALHVETGSLLVVHVREAIGPHPLFVQPWHGLSARYLQYHTDRIFGKL